MEKIQMMDVATLASLDVIDGANELIDGLLCGEGDYCELIDYSDDTFCKYAENYACQELSAEKFVAFVVDRLLLNADNYANPQEAVELAREIAFNIEHQEI